MENTDGLMHTLVPDVVAMHRCASKGESSDIVISGDAPGSTRGPGNTLGESKSSGGEKLGGIERDTPLGNLLPICDGTLAESGSRNVRSSNQPNKRANAVYRPGSRRRIIISR